MRDKFEFLKIAVANPNLGHWLRMKVLSKVPELSAGVEVKYLDEVLADCLKTNYDGGLELISGRDYPCYILDALMNHWCAAFMPFRKYVKGDANAQGGDTPLKIETLQEARKAVQLADRLAQLIDSYEATGHLETLKSNIGKNAIYAAEQALVKTLFGNEGLLKKDGRISMRQMFEDVKNVKDPKHPPQIHMFGHTMLTKLQAEILKWMKDHGSEVSWYRPKGGTGEVLPLWQAARNKTKEICGDLKNIDVAQSNSDKDTVLHNLQKLLSGENVSEKKEQDSSLQIIGVPGIRREVEMVYNAILGAVWKDNDNGKPVRQPGMSFSDIGVLVTDMAKYRPMIEAVFSGRDQIPYGIVDVTTQDYSSCLDGFLALMDIARYGLNRKRVFAVLENPCVRQAMNFTRDDVVKWRELIQKYGAYDGFESGDSAEANKSGNFNWNYALQRMRLGLVSAEMPAQDGNNASISLEPSDAGYVYKFSEVIETLQRKLAALKVTSAVFSSADEKLWSDSWAGRLHGIMDEFLAVDKDNEIEATVRAKIVRALNSLRVVSGNKQNFELSVAMVEHAVSAAEYAKGGYLHHGVTFGNLRSLANVPFRQIFVMGLSEGSIPGHDDKSTLDVRNELDKRTDVLRSEEDKEHFLSAVMSAQDRLVLSYPNCSLSDDARLYPSSLVIDVKECASAQLLKSSFQEFSGYPLSEFAREINKPENAIKSCLSVSDKKDCFSGLLPTYSRFAFVLAGLMEDTKENKDDSASTQEQEEQSEPTPKDLAEFVKNPFTAILKRRLGIATTGYREQSIDDASPLEVVSGPVQWELETEIVKGNFAQAFQKAQRKGKIPTGALGDFVKKQYDDPTDQEHPHPVQWAEQNVSKEDRELLDDPAHNPNRVIVCRNFDEGTRNEPITIPSDAVLEPLFARLAQAKKENKSGFDFSVKVIDVKKKKCAEWKWTINALDYYDTVVHAYKNWLATGKEGTYPDITYGELRKELKDCPSDRQTVDWWKQKATNLSENKLSYDGNKNDFDNSPVVDKIVEDFRREPTGEDLKNLFEVLFCLPMAGEKDATDNNGNGNGGAQ